MPATQTKRGFHIDADVSDLFFNTDVSNAALHGPGGQFTGYDFGILTAEARSFLGCLLRLGVPNLPTEEELIADFLSRC